MDTSTQSSVSEYTAVLERTPPALDALLRGLPDVWLHSREGRTVDGKETWNAVGIVGHLIYTERMNWMPRVGMLLKYGETRPFDPLDRLPRTEEFPENPETIGTLLDEFARLRRESLVALNGLHLAPADMRRQGIHPALGAVTLGNLLATWVTHDLTHLHQLTRVMAHQYREAVGPWSVYLGVLHCKGHSEP
jgi:hypothetical protein